MHDHKHEHPRNHSHDHGHSHENGMSEMLALLSYMAAHNFTHAEELDDMAERLRSEGYTEAAERTAQAAEYLTVAGAQLNEAVSLLHTEE